MEISSWFLTQNNLCSFIYSHIKFSANAIGCLILIYYLWASCFMYYSYLTLESSTSLILSFVDDGCCSPLASYVPFCFFCSVWMTILVCFAVLTLRTVSWSPMIIGQIDGSLLSGIISFIPYLYYCFEAYLLYNSTFSHLLMYEVVFIWCNSLIYILSL